jgi:flagellar biosynthesis regulator FlaF
MNRHQLARRVDELAAEHSGQAFADAITELAATLDEYEKEELQRVLLERAANLDQAVMDRVDARGWFRRQWDRASGGR